MLNVMASLFEDIRIIKQRMLEFCNERLNKLAHVCDPVALLLPSSYISAWCKSIYAPQRVSLCIDNLLIKSVDAVRAEHLVFVITLIIKLTVEAPATPVLSSHNTTQHSTCTDDV